MNAAKRRFRSVILFVNYLVTVVIPGGLIIHHFGIGELLCPLMCAVLMAYMGGRVSILAVNNFDVVVSLVQAIGCAADIKCLSSFGNE